MKYYSLLYIFFLNIFVVCGYIPNAMAVICKETLFYNTLLEANNLQCHLMSSRIKTFESAIYKLNKLNKLNQELSTRELTTRELSTRELTTIEKKDKFTNPDENKLYYLHDLIGFRFVFYNNYDLLKFYHFIKYDRMIMYSNNYIIKPKDNGYKAMHIRYLNVYNECPIKQVECQLYIINDYYDALYGNAIYDKNYSMYL